MTKAHRRVKVHPKDWGAMACKISSASQTVWLNKTGTFGVASAAFWWSRLMGLFGRLAWGVMLDDWFFALVFVDDIHMAAGGSNRWLTLWRVIAMMEMIGVPFSYHKFRGGFQLDYVGFWMDYTRGSRSGYLNLRDGPSGCLISCNLYQRISGSYTSSASRSSMGDWGLLHKSCLG